MPFTNPVGLTRVVPSILNQIFFLFFTTSVLEHIVEQSNKYAAECMGELFAKWEPITTDELSDYFGFVILIGIVKLPSIHDYWKKDEIYCRCVHSSSRHRQALSFMGVPS